jgi:hypothetical protein
MEKFEIKKIHLIKTCMYAVCQYFIETVMLQQVNRRGHELQIKQKL